MIMNWIYLHVENERQFSCGTGTLLAHTYMNWQERMGSPKAAHVLLALVHGSKEALGYVSWEFNLPTKGILQLLT